MPSPKIELPLLDLPEGPERQLGCLYLSRENKRIQLPLAAVDISAKVINRVAEVTVRQVFANQSTEHLEAVYIFPLAPGSAISNFNMKVGGRTITGVVRERAEARKQYQEAVDSGKRAALMEQERDDVFTVKVGNLPPGEEVTVEIIYAEKLPFLENGASELRLPLVVSPRYIPGTELSRDPIGDGVHPDTNLVPDASRITPPRLLPGLDAQAALTLKVELLPEDDSELDDLYCSQHVTRTSISQGAVVISLSRSDERLNRDFVLRFSMRHDKVKTSLITHTSPDGQTYGLLSIMPPKRSGYVQAARDVVFLFDRSGSMAGIKLISAIKSCSILLNTLGPQDRFAIASFSNGVHWMQAHTNNKFLHADAKGIEAGEKYLRAIEASGGTEMDSALANVFQVLAARDKESSGLPSLVVLTDGEVGNENRIMQRVQNEIGEARLFAVGIDTSVNSGLLKRLANLGGGTAAFVEPGAKLEEALTGISREIGVPLVTDLKLEDMDLCVDNSSLSPQRVPDIFTGRASVCFFKIQGKSKGKLCVKGKFADGKQFEEKVKAQSVDMEAIAQLWAKAHIVDLEDQYRINPGIQANLKREIIDIAVMHKLLCKFTAFVVVDESEIVNKDGQLNKVVQPVEYPAGWDMINIPASGAAFGAPAPPAAQSYGYFQAPASAAFQAPQAHPQAPQAQPQARKVQPQAPQAQQQFLPSQSSLGGQSGSYGMGARQQVFEVIVRQAMAGAPWREICAGPMQVNNIAPQEIEAELNRRLGLQGGTTSEQQQQQKQRTTPEASKKAKYKSEVLNSKKALNEFLSEFSTAFELLAAGKLPDPVALENVRVNLLQVLAPTELGMELPCLQRFLRSTARELVSAIRDKSLTIAEVYNFFLSKHENFESTKQEINQILNPTETSFWDELI